MVILEKELYVTFRRHFLYFGRAEQLGVRGYTQAQGVAFSCLRLKLAEYGADLTFSDSGLTPPHLTATADFLASPSQALFPIPPNYNSPLCDLTFSRPFSPSYNSPLCDLTFSRPFFIYFFVLQGRRTRSSRPGRTVAASTSSALWARSSWRIWWPGSSSRPDPRRCRWGSRCATAGCCTT